MNNNTTCENCNCPVRGGTLTMALSAIALVLLVANMVMVVNAQSTQQQVIERQARINEGQQLSNLNQQLVQALGSAAVGANKDKKIESLLAQHGITIEANKPAGETKK